MERPSSSRSAPLMLPHAEITGGQVALGALQEVPERRGIQAQTWRRQDYEDISAARRFSGVHGRGGMDLAQKAEERQRSSWCLDTWRDVSKLESICREERQNVPKSRRAVRPRRASENQDPPA